MLYYLTILLEAAKKRKTTKQRQKKKQAGEKALEKEVKEQRAQLKSIIIKCSLIFSW